MTTLQQPLPHTNTLFESFYGTEDKPSLLVSQICDALLADIDQLCEMAKKTDPAKDPDSVTRSYLQRRRENTQYNGSYIGIMIGQGGLGLGFLEKAISNELHRRLKEKAEQHTNGTWEEVVMCEEDGGPHVTLCRYYSTANGMYELDYSYTYILKKKRVE